MMRKTSLCVSIEPTNDQELEMLYQEALSYADVVEIRLNKNSSLDTLKEYIKKETPLILKALDCDAAFLERLCGLEPSFLDIDSTFPKELFFTLKKAQPEVKIIASYHNYENSDFDLSLTFQKLKELKPDCIKIVGYANSSIDALKMLTFLKEHTDDIPLTCFCMGKKGAFSRILQPIYGGIFAYSSLQNRQVISCQIAASELIERYHFQKLNLQTQVFALVGSPIDESLSHETHNALFRHFAVDAVYVKIELNEQEFIQAKPLFERLRFSGLSITQPLKYLTTCEDLTPYNTFSFKHRKALNTDGKAALDAIERCMSVHNKKVLVVGAGATGHAIAQEAKKRRAEVMLCNRTENKREKLASALSCKTGLFLEEYSDADVIVKATGGKDDIDGHLLQKGQVAFDVEREITTPFLEAAKQKGVLTVAGQEMWLRQAAGQIHFWFPELREEDAFTFLSQHVASFVSLKKSHMKGQVTLASSKSQTLRAILFATLAEGTSIISHPLPSPDTDAMVEACRVLGAEIESYGNGYQVKGIGLKRKLLAKKIDAKSSGITLRFVSAVLALFEDEVIIDGDSQLRERRSMSELIKGLEQLGCKKAYSLYHNNYAPLCIQGKILKNVATIEGKDSQPVSALLIASSLLDGKETEIFVNNPGETPWITLTLSWLKKMGVEYEQKDFSYYRVKGVKTFAAFNYKVPGDLSTLSFYLAMGLVLEADLAIHNVFLDDLQGDKVILEIVKKMGAHFTYENHTLTLKGPQKLFGVEIDVNPVIDALPILAILGCFAEGETRLYNGKICRDKECDRIAAITCELKKMGADIAEDEDGLRVRKSQLKGARLKSHDDHRIAMALSVASLACEGASFIYGIECVKKSNPHFFDDIRRLKAYG